MGLRVVVADDSYLVREAITHVLADAPGSSCARCASTATSLMAAIEAEAPDVVRHRHPHAAERDDEGVRVATSCATHIRGSASSCSACTSSRATRSSCSRGPTAAPTCSRSASTTARCLAAIEAVAAGGSVIDPKVVEMLVAARSRAASLPARRLTRARARDPRRDRPGQEQRGDRDVAAAEQARRREAHQLALHEARAARVRGRQPARQGGAALPRRRGAGRRRRAARPRSALGTRGGGAGAVLREEQERGLHALLTSGAPRGRAS